VTRRSYNQLCPIARTLDILGERWTILIIRNLFFGPQRYSDLVADLPGVPRNLLAARLKELEEEGFIRRRKLPPPAQSVAVYELTERREDIEPLLVSLARLGVRSLGQAQTELAFRPAWGILAIRAAFRPEAARDVRETYEFRIEDETFHVSIDDGAADLKQGPAVAPDLVIACDASTFMAVGSRSLSPKEAIMSRRATMEGASAALKHCIEIFGLLSSEGDQTT
jgi:DNA-binding HxlR family transcriptional regulator/putative sterol carrier protein